MKWQMDEVSRMAVYCAASAATPTSGGMQRVHRISPHLTSTLLQRSCMMMVSIIS